MYICMYVYYHWSEHIFQTPVKSNLRLLLRAVGFNKKPKKCKTTDTGSSKLVLTLQKALNAGT